MNSAMEQITMKILPVAIGIFRDFVLLCMLIFLWKIIAAKTTDLYDKIIFAFVGIALLAGGFLEISAVIRFPLIGAAVVAYCHIRKKCDTPKIAFLLLLLYNIHALAYLIAICFYDFGNKICNSRLDYSSPDILEQIYMQVAVAQILLMLVYGMLVMVLMIFFRKISTGSFNMGWKDFCFLSVLNVVGIIFSYMIIRLSVVKLETDVFVLFDERQDALWKVPVMSALILVGEFSSIYVWQQYCALLMEKENVLIYESKLKQVKERLDEADSFYGNVRALKHDIKNHINNIRNLNAKGEFESASVYMEKIDQALEEMDYKFSTGNTVCDVIVNDKYCVCRKEDIDFKSEFEFYDEAGVASFDMGIILSNLLDNAIEACRKVEIGERFVELKSKVKGSFVLLEISNSYVGEIIFDGGDGLPVSTKLTPVETVPQSQTNVRSVSEALPKGRRRTCMMAKSQPALALEKRENGLLSTELAAQSQSGSIPVHPHGIGLRSSKRVVEKYLGNLKIEKTDKRFTVIVMLQINCPVDTL